MAHTTFRFRLPERDLELLASVAVIENKSVSAMARQIFSDGIQRILHEIETARPGEASDG